MSRLPIVEVRTKYVVMKPLELVDDSEKPEVVVLPVNPDQLSALVFMTDYSRGSGEAAIAPFGGACWSVLQGNAEAEREMPRGVAALFDIS